MDKIIAVSLSTKNDKERIFRIPKGRIEIVYPGVDTNHFNSCKDGRDTNKLLNDYNLPERYVLCVGKYTFKNLRASIKAIKILESRYKFPVKLLVAGYKENVTRDILYLIEEMGLEEDVIFTRFFPNTDLKYLYQKAELLLLPFVYEGFGLPILEAYACGTPVVTSRSSSLPEVAGDAGSLVDPKDPEEIAAAMARILSDEELKKTKLELGLQRVKKFNWAEAGKRMIQIFEKVLEAK